ncbi:MAG: hypothetical protein Q9208_005084 [Pyrenodesmia sp. 3 TL-2023]
MLKSRFREGTEGVIDLPDVLAAVIDRFALWLYIGSLFEPAGSAGEEYDQANWSLLISKWIFGHTYDIPCLQNEVAKAMLAAMRRLPEVPSLVKALTQFEPTAPLKRMLAQLLALKADPKVIDHGSSELTKAGFDRNLQKYQQYRLSSLRITQHAAYLENDSPRQRPQNMLGLDSTPQA